VVSHWLCGVTGDGRRATGRVRAGGAGVGGCECGSGKIPLANVHTNVVPQKKN